MITQLWSLLGFELTRLWCRLWGHGVTLGDGPAQCQRCGGAV